PAGPRPGPPRCICRPCRTAARRAPSAPGWWCWATAMPGRVFAATRRASPSCTARWARTTRTRRPRSTVCSAPIPARRRSSTSRSWSTRPDGSPCAPTAPCCSRAGRPRRGTGSARRSACSRPWRAWCTMTSRNVTRASGPSPCTGKDVRSDGAQQRRPTITQVAEAAGVSRATVSRVLNGRTSVDPLIGARVREAADRLQYRPNLTARYLSTGRTMTVSLVIPDLGNPMFQSVLRSLTRAAEADGYGVLVAEAPTAEREARIARDARRQCDAVVLVAPRMNDLELEALIGQISPVVVLNRQLPDPRIATVGIDYASGMSQLVAHLESLGHRDLLYVAGPPRSAAHHARLTALNTLIDASPSLTRRTRLGGSTMTDGHRVAEQVLGSGATAAIAFNDLVAFGLLARLNEFGVDVPGDISVTGFDGIELSRFAVPALTTVGQEELETGALAWRRLHHQLAPSGESEPTDHTLLIPRLIVGD